MIRLKRLGQAGFTITEMAVVVTVTSILLIVVTNFTLGNMVETSLATSREEILHETQNSLDLTANDIRLSANADANNRWPDANAPDSEDDYSWESNSSTLVLATAAEDVDGNILFADTHNYITHKNNLIYFVQNGTLFKRTIAADIENNSKKTTCPKDIADDDCPADQEILHNVSQFSVTYLDGNNQSVAPTSARSVQLRVVVNKKVYSRTLSADYTTRMVFRND